MDIRAKSKQKLKEAFDLFIENPRYPGIMEALIEAIRAFNLIAVFEKQYQEEGTTSE